MKIRNALGLAALALACMAGACSDSAQPVQPPAAPQYDGGVTVGTGNRSDSTVVRTNAGADTATAK